LFDIAASLGSDVPFVPDWPAPFLGVGRGEEVYPLEAVKCDHLLLQTQGLPVSTATAY